MEEPGPRKRDFGTDPGDLGIIAIALVLSLAFFAVLFSRWQTPKLSVLFTPDKPKIVPKPETDMLLFPSKPAPSAPQPAPRKNSQ